MANDIALAKSGPIKNGTMINSCNIYGTIIKQDTYVKNVPTITDIESKYDNRFDNGILVALVGTSGVIGV